MALQREELLNEFMNKTGADKSEAVKILTRNKWNLPDSYKEIERMCLSAGQRNHRYLHNYDSSAKNMGAQNLVAIDTGLGAVVNLDKKKLTGLPPQSSTALSNTVRPIQQGSNIPLEPQKLGDQSKKPAALSVQLPTSSKGQDRIIPIQMEGGRIMMPPQSHPEIYKPTVSRNLDPSPYHSSHSTSSHQHNQPATANFDPHHSQPRAILDENVHPSRPSMIAPAMGKEAATDYSHEDEDVFDEKTTSKPPPVTTVPRLKRGFSNILENEGLVSEARHNVQADIKKDSHNNMYVQTFLLPNLNTYSEDFKAFLGKELIETSTLVSLEQAGRLNWWAEMRLCQRLLPMATSGDGNCLLHAASLAMWGIHDRQLILRTELHETLTKATYKNALYRRWRYQQTMSNKQSGLVFSEDEWKEEWANILRLASPLPRGAPDPSRSNNCCDSPVTHGSTDPVVYESLEEFHVFVLAHVLQRPIIVVADAMLKDSQGDALAPIPFPGIYLPLEVHPCFKYPLLLTYDAAHFSALAPMEQDPSYSPQLPAAIPLVDPELNLLPLHFHKDPGPAVDWSKNLIQEPSMEDKYNLLQKFLDVEKLPLKLADTNGDSDRASCGSQDSDELNTLVKDKDKKKDEKKKDARMSQQVQTVAKQFGSIGKSMGKKLKQLGKVGKGDKSRRGSVGNEITQSTRVISSYGTPGSGHEVVLVAKLSEKQGKHHQEIIKNYLEDAERRFKFDRELKRKSDVELRSKVARYPAVSPSFVCETPGCRFYGTAQTNYLCAQCYASQQRESAMVQRSGSQVSYNTFPGRGKQSIPPKASDEIFVCGKSKFYTNSNEDIDQPPKPSSLTVSNLDKQTSRSSNSIPVSRARSPSPDYDNVSNPYSQSYQRSSPKPLPKQQQGQQYCRSSGCSFYGNRNSDGFCSKCYQKMYKDSLSRATVNTVRL